MAANWWLAVIDAYDQIAGVPNLSFSKGPEGLGIPCVTLTDGDGETGFGYQSGEVYPEKSVKAAAFTVYEAGQQNVEALAQLVRDGLPANCLQLDDRSAKWLMLKVFKRLGEQPLLSTDRQKVFGIRLGYQAIP